MSLPNLQVTPLTTQSYYLRAASGTQCPGCRNGSSLFTLGVVTDHLSRSSLSQCDCQWRRLEPRAGPLQSSLAHFWPPPLAGPQLRSPGTDPVRRPGRRRSSTAGYDYCCYFTTAWVGAKRKRSGTEQWRWELSHCLALCAFIKRL
eukprot:493914-Rhodomonas_salina.1